MNKFIILHIGPQPPIGGGIVTYIEGLLKSDLINKYQIRFLNTKCTKPVKLYKIFRVIFTIVHSLKLLTIVIFQKPEIAHIHTSSGASFWEKSLLCFICKGFGVKVILHLHSGEFDIFCFKGWKKFIVPRILSFMDMNIVLSKKWYELFKKFIPEEKLIMLPNAINTQEFLTDRKKKSNSSCINILFVGLVDKKKGLVELAYAARNLSDFVSVEFNIDIIGANKNLKQLEAIKKKYKDLDLEKNVKFRGSIYGSKKLDYYKIADIFVLPSYNESFGIVNLEAMASGLPIISTKVGAIPEYLVHGENGFLIDPGNIDQLTEYLRILINDPELREKMGNNNRLKVVKEYDWSIISKKIDHLYQSLLS